ncbi:outer membrane lipid asymmetry maintenance protein MlaD [Gluconacetobacter liquefaciens]|uniref:MCE family protein n=1 Tax=Gluconacetobacter liquefaciens TaxID=89584 RepID=A0A370G526_GLULI|nr:MlaD family protein [Gluconacetobacter liquefaciens]MBB2186316.1 MCE family protein [Gluconacetobacter liquefaciens]RDI38855.1 phospholipid/cholesterol/gamma-HCH transport system substrate-binding protein [Gluconacetobacter liquefaciens]GBQ99998.1 toluene ABC transporter periplasmic protein [Gluconacetobacter liquefaciens NRIC 0522]GEB36494.1 outer membrane lipid asymmetry maintenance protein MlaD [Gluconacetobacter liquefaciens]
MVREKGSAVVFSSLVLLVAVVFYVYARASQTDLSGDRYSLTARFISANGLHVGADVQLAGVPVGRVTDIVLDPVMAVANVRFTVDRALSLPNDSAVVIGSATMTSDNSLMIQPGKAKDRLTAGAVITNAQEAVSLEQQVSNYIFGNGGLPSDSAP